MNRAALVVIDAQESFRQRPIWAYASRPDIAGQVDRLVGAARVHHHQPPAAAHPRRHP